MIEKILNEIKSTKITLSQWMLGFIGIFFVRFFLESLSSPTVSGLIPSIPYTIVHYVLFWITLTLGLIIILGYFCKDYIFASKISLFGLPVIWLAPIFDITISKGEGFTQSYIFDTGNKLIIDFLTFFGPTLKSGATYGIRIEMLIVIIGIGWYLWAIRKSKFQVTLGIVSVYIFGFIMGSLPGIIYTLSHINDSASTVLEISAYFREIVFESSISHNTLIEGTPSVMDDQFLYLGFDKLMSQILFIISLIFGTFLSWKIDHKKSIAIIRNIRLERIASYLTLLICGMGFAYINNLGNPLILLDLLGIICLIISWISLWMYAVHINDVADIEIDKISNTDRPLVKKDLDSESMLETGKVWLVIALIGSWCAGFYPFFMSLIYLATSYVYSAPPLRLRRFPILPSFLIGIASLGTILAGFFFISVDKQVQVFPTLLSAGIVIMVTLAINVKDMKDIEGDKANGITTLPILFGNNGPKVVGLCFAISFLLVPVFLSFYLLYIVAIPTSIIGYKLVTKKAYREEPIFILRFTFIFLIGLCYLGAYWLAQTYNIV